MKKILLTLIAATVLYANEASMCKSLCGPCAETPEDATCMRLDSLCSCQALLDNIAKNKELFKEKALASEGKSKFYSRTVHFKDGVFVDAQKAKNPLTEDQLKQFHKEHNRASANAEAPIQVPSMGDQCKQICTSCPADTSLFETTATAPENTKNPLCNKVEETCKCYEYSRALWQAAKFHEQDSIAKIEASLNRIQNENAVTDSIFGVCDTVGDCYVIITMHRETGLLVEVAKTATDAAKDSATAVVAVDSLETGRDKVEPTKNDEKPKAPTKSGDIFYWGIGLVVGSLDENDFLENHIDGANEMVGDLNIEAGISFLFRWYFYSAGSFQFGLSALYRHHDYMHTNGQYLGEISNSLFGTSYETLFVDLWAEYHELLAEIPLSLRIGIPIVKFFAPFADLTFSVRKPIYGWNTADIYGWRVDETFNWDGDFYSEEDWEFLLWLGPGIEFTKHFSVEILFMLIDAKSGIGHNYTDENDSFRLNLQFAW